MVSCQSLGVRRLRSHGNNERHLPDALTILPKFQILLWHFVDPLSQLILAGYLVDIVLKYIP